MGEAAVGEDEVMVRKARGSEGAQVNFILKGQPTSVPLTQSAWQRAATSRSSGSSCLQPPMFTRNDQTCRDKSSNR